MSNTDPTEPNAFHLVHPTLSCRGKRGIVFKQRRETLTIFRAGNFLHSSSVPEHECNADFPSLGLGCVKKSKVESVVEQRADVVETFVEFRILQVYKSHKAPSRLEEEPKVKRRKKKKKGTKIMEQTS